MTGVTIAVDERSARQVRSTWTDGDERLGSVTISASVDITDQTTDAWLVAGLPTAMRRGGLISAEGAADATLVSNIAQAGALLNGWYRHLATPVVQVPAEQSTRPPSTGVGCFFSGGVDSFYSALKNRDQLTHLIFVQGFDVDVDNDVLGAEALEAARRSALALGLELIEVRTDIRHLIDQYVDWGKEGHGAAMGAVGHLLGPLLGRVIVPASYHVDDLHPWGSHPELDPLWSSSTVRFEHHGDDATRPQKVAFIAQHQAAMDNLRVCWKNPNNAYNCGRCEKCIRTIINLRVAGAADLCKTLPNSLAPADLRGLRMGHGSQIFARENLAEMARSGVRDRPLERALRRAVLAGYAYDAARAVKLRLFKR